LSSSAKLTELDSPKKSIILVTLLIMQNSQLILN